MAFMKVVSLSALWFAFAFLGLTDGRARDTVNYWPSHAERQVLIDLCPSEVQEYLKDLDEVKCRSFFASITDDNISLAAIKKTLDDRPSLEQLEFVRRKSISYVRKLPQAALRQTAEERCDDIVMSYVQKGFQFSPSKRSGEAEKPGKHTIEIPINNNIEYVLIASTGSLNLMGVPIKLKITAEDNDKLILARDDRALATAISVVRWKSAYNGTGNCVIEFLPSAIFDQHVKCDWFVAVGRRSPAIGK